MAPHQEFSDTGSSRGLVFTVRRREPELIRPVGPTPREYKKLSDIDGQEGLRFHIRTIQFYRCNPCIEGKDPVQAIRDGLARVLVYYYPLAGRLREWEGRKLVVDCTGEGVMFIEADADVRLEQFGDVLHPPFPYMEELLFDVPGFGGIIDSPLMLIQVTRLMCGGFIFAVRLNHTMTDAFGLFQFMNAVAEMARGATAPSILPVWQRELLDARDPPRVTFAHCEYDEVTVTKGTTTNLPSLQEMSHRTFFFGQPEITAIRNSVPHHLRSCSTNFELLVACIWRCRTIALQPHPEEEMRMLSLVNARQRFKTSLPVGYYGNACAYPAALSSAGKLCRNPLGYALQLVRNAKAQMTEEYMKYVADFMVTKGRPGFTVPGAFITSDLTRAKFDEVDYGWGKPAYGGVPGGGEGPVPGMITFHLPGMNRDGGRGILVPICLPLPAMDRFVEALENILKGHEAVKDSYSTSVSSSLRRTSFSSYTRVTASYWRKRPTYVLL